MPRRSSARAQRAGFGPSSKPIACASRARAPHTSRRTPDQGIAPKHIAHGSLLVTSSWTGDAGSPRSKWPRTRCAKDSASISACASDRPLATTTFTPTATRRPVSRSKTAAPNGPPLPRRPFSPASAMASSMRISGERRRRPPIRVSRNPATQRGRRKEGATRRHARGNRHAPSDTRNRAAVHFSSRRQQASKRTA